MPFLRVVDTLRDILDGQLEELTLRTSSNTYRPFRAR